MCAVIVTPSITKPHLTSPTPSHSMSHQKILPLLASNNLGKNALPSNLCPFHWDCGTLISEKFELLKTKFSVVPSASKYIPFVAPKYPTL